MHREGITHVHGVQFMILFEVGQLQDEKDTYLWKHYIIIANMITTKQQIQII